MQGIEVAYCDACIAALIKVYSSLMELSPTEALKKVRYGKNDTLGLDAIPEIIISEQINVFDQSAILITEESDERTSDRWPTSSDPLLQPLMLISDPTDRSKQLKNFIESLGKDEISKSISELAGQDTVGIWEGMFEKPASITGATSSLTCIRKGVIIFTVIINYITGEIFVACEQGIVRFNIKLCTDNSELEKINLNHILTTGKRIAFSSCKTSCRNGEDYLRFVTFLGKTGYEENFRDSMLFVGEAKKHLHHKEPGGPSRVLYLSELQKDPPIGFVVANGEKITEWSHWLAFVKFAKTEQNKPALRLFEISIEQPWTKDGILMSPPPCYSIFQREGDRSYLDLSRISNFRHPSKFRSMLVIIPTDNERMTYTMRQHNYREVTMCL